MKKYRILIAFIFLLISTVTFPQALGEFKPGSEPNGFRGIRWETDLSSPSGMKYTRTDRSYGGIKAYIRTGDELQIRGARLETIK